jgi:uncharacterized protein
MIAVFTMMLMVTAAFTGASQAASFDCAKAVSKTEKMICSTPALSKADEVMAAAYKTAIGLASRFAPDDTKGIKEDQVAWLRERQRNCEDRPCLVDAYKERNEALAFYVAQVNRNPANVAAFTGTYRMGQNGTLEVVQLPNGSIKFSLNMTRVFELSTGDVRSGDAFGEVPLKSVIAEYTSSEYGGCRITMTFQKTKAILSQDGMCGFGLNVDAGGTYMKTSNAVPKFERDELLKG